MREILREGDPEVVFGQPAPEEPHKILSENQLIENLTKEDPSFPVENLDFHGSGAGDLGAYLDHLLELEELRKQAPFETDIHAVSGLGGRNGHPSGHLFGDHQDLCQRDR